ncbi:hypothetical protein [Corynebacterium tapiri]
MQVGAAAGEHDEADGEEGHDGGDVQNPRDYLVGDAAEHTHVLLGLVVAAKLQQGHCNNDHE